MKTRILQEDRNRGNQVGYIRIQDGWSRSEGRKQDLINTQPWCTCLVFLASHSTKHSAYPRSPPHQRALITEAITHAQKDMGRGNERQGVRESNHTPAAYRSIVQNKSIPTAIWLTWQDLGQDRNTHSCQRTMCIFLFFIILAWMKENEGHVYKSRSQISLVEKHKISLSLLCHSFVSEKTPKRVPLSCTATQAWCSCLWEEHCVRWWGWRTPRLALEVRRRFIFLGRPLSKNILRSVLRVHQVLTRQSLLAVKGELLWDGKLLSFSWFGGIHLHFQVTHSCMDYPYGMELTFLEDRTRPPCMYCG